jgi:hypothetical protein
MRNLISRSVLSSCPALAVANSLGEMFGRLERVGMANENHEVA